MDTVLALGEIPGLPACAGPLPNLRSVAMKNGVNGLARRLATICLGLAVLLALTLSVNLWLATSLHDNSANAVAMPHPTPDPHP